MMHVFSSLGLDFLVAAGLGGLGGVGLDLVQDTAVQLPTIVKPILIGALAAVLAYALNQPTDVLKLVAMSLTAGLGGTGILKGYVNARGLDKFNTLAESAVGAAEEASGRPSGQAGDALTARIDDLRTSLDQAQRRFAVR